MRSWRQTVLSQYDQSPHLIALLESIDEWISPDTNFEAFYQCIWEIRPIGGASGYGLDVWGRIVNVKRVLTVTTSTYFGFQEAGDRTGFNQAAFWDTSPVTENFTLTDEVYRLLIFAKTALNITNSSIPAINTILRNLFPGRGNTYVTDGRNGATGTWFGFQEAGDRVGFGQGPFMDFMPLLSNNMTLTYVFDFVLNPFEIAIVTVSGVLPKPVGVKASTKFI
jgi:hypothetical protein